MMKYIIFICLSLLAIIPTNSYSQENGVSKDTIKKDPVTALNNFVKYSEALAQNETPHSGTVNGYLGGISNFVREFGPKEIFNFSTNNFDSIQFYFEWDDQVIRRFFIPVSDNKPFEYIVNPIREISNFRMSVDNNELKELVNQKLYEVIINDDVDPNNIIVEPTEESAKFIYIWKIDSLSVNYQIRLKDKNEFVRNLSEDEIRKWKKGDELSFDVGITLSDKNVPSDVVTYTLFLKKEKKPRKRSS